jgi:hypothetical protein
MIEQIKKERKGNNMKKYLKYVFTLFILMLMLGCGGIRRLWEQTSYKSITGKHGTLTLISYSLFKVYPDVKIIYSSSDSNSIMFKDETTNKTLFWQGDALFEEE